MPKLNKASMTLIQEIVENYLNEQVTAHSAQLKEAIDRGDFKRVMNLMKEAEAYALETVQLMLENRLLGGK